MRETLHNYLLRVHPETIWVGHGGRRPLNNPKSLGRPIYCQRFFLSAAGSTFFEIRSSVQAKRLLQKPAGISYILAVLDRIEVSAQQLLHGANSLSEIQAQLDKVCLAFSIALLDYSLKGDLFESALVGFLAALGIDTANQIFYELYGYTGYLSGLVKIV
ncbi:hypothetical protein BDV27DRAFT_163648 [Aspergillus caelatus]|uniref:Uncharacterized protein n=1 Tax=Aspergillus caelatus TaxID=61420 RepID=A0A5N6ZQ99_9EURO|nr:uncharacterized protein BDV27DRAFT_163648 [Aspergillus caelatus]KAE8358370.1 hypothetical protein BDV27DRAFT_163648 [Aspergillus caelatus]